jgi:hypothetical protein
MSDIVVALQSSMKIEAEREKTMTLKLALVACLGLGAYAQTPAPAAPQVSAQSITIGTYLALLSEMEGNEKLSDRVEAAGHDPKHVTRKWLQRNTGLTDQEFTKVRSILLDGISATKALKAQVDDIAAQSRLSNGGVQKLTLDQHNAVVTLNMQRLQMIQDHINQIEKALGPTRFQEFDAALRKSIGAGVKVIPSRPPAGPAGKK